MSDSAIDSFEHEATELLNLMEESLLRLENSPSDEALINAIFRAAHTIKGTGGVFGFDNIVEFTHSVENVLDHVRAGDIRIESDLIAILLSCRDHVGALVQLAIAGNEILSDAVRDEGQQLIGRLEPYLGHDEKQLSQNDINKMLAEEGNFNIDEDGNPVIFDNWHISMRFERDVLQNGMDPISFIRYLRKMGEVSVITLYDELPSLEITEPEHCYLAFEVNFEGEVERKQIESVFEFVKEMSEIHILPPTGKFDLYAEMIEQLPDEEMRLGEILLKCGAVSASQLGEVLAEQSRQKISAEGQAGDETGKKIGEILVEQHVVKQEVVNAALVKQEKVMEQVKTANRVIRVDANKLDSLINLVGELVIAGASSNLLARKLGDEKLLESMSSMGRLVEEIRDSALSLRMVPIGETFNRFQRVVRDTSKEMGKAIQLEISGAETELDKTVVERIGDPLMHLVRNSMDHGIESSQERLSAGKAAQGTLKLNAFHDSGSIVIEVTDDGRGLSREKILAKAKERDMHVDEAGMSDKDVYRLIFEAGFTTADKITNLSGRGVGMDVVKRNIEALRGTVDVDSQAGQGTTINIRLPLTLAIIDGFLVGVSGSNYVIPLDTIHECIELDEEEQSQVAVQSYINLRGEVLPFLRLRDFFNESNSEVNRENIVVVQFGNQKAGFVVDELLGEFQTVIKPMGKILQKLKGISGATILGSGDVAVILDVPNLIQRATETAETMHGRVQHAGHTLASGDDNPVIH